MNMQQAIDQVILNVKILLTQNKIKEALQILDKEIAKISSNLETSIILKKAALNRLNQQKMDGLISLSEYNRGITLFTRNLIMLMDTVDDELEVKRIMGEYSSIYSTTSLDRLERIQGPDNNLVEMKWIYQCIESSKSICKVLRSDGKSGTGWMLKDGWMMTNFHVIPNIAWVEKSEIIFNYEEDLNGHNSQTSRYRLDPEGAVFSKLLELDYAFVKVHENGELPVSNWGYLEPDLFSDPQIDQRVTIIQHPKGEKKQIALTDNKVISVDGHKLFYLTDTEKGSSGSPVLNSDWKVVALHHAGKTEDDGGLVIDAATGEKRGANEGILIKDIMKDIEEKRGN